MLQLLLPLVAIALLWILADLGQRRRERELLQRVKNLGHCIPAISDEVDGAIAVERKREEFWRRLGPRAHRGRMVPRAGKERIMSMEPTELEIGKIHRRHAGECNNIAWSLSDLPHRTPAQDSQMLDAAHASAYHWSKIGTELNAARAKMLLGHVHAALGHGELATRYAQESCAYLIAHDPPDWELAFAHAVLAHAAFAAGETSLHRDEYAKAETLGHAIADPEDREIFFKTFDLIPRQ